VATDDPVELAHRLVQISSADHSVDSESGSGERAVAHYIAAWLEHRDLEYHWIEPTQGCHRLVGVGGGSDGGKSVLLNGHSDTIT
jgi:acetylornithine deacetylase/succinyl-diaminopimelate desuccinylase-like protein